MTDEAERLLVELVKAPSVSGRERRASEVFVRHARAMGFEAEIDEVGSALAHRGPREARVHIVLLGHIDTVPGEVPVRVEGGELWGRGSVDAKGPLCAMLVAAARAELEDGVRVTVAGAAGEETPHSPGARLIASRYRPSACIIGEPSHWDGVTLGYKGRLVVHARIKKPCAHSAGPEASASDELFAWWSEALAEAERVSAGRERVFDRVQASVRGMASQSDGLTQSADLTCGFRLPPGLAPEAWGERLRELAPAGMELRTEGGERAVVSERSDAVVRAITSAIRAEGGTPRPRLKTGTSDMNVVGPVWGCPVAAYGPGDSALDHTPEERLGLAEYARAIAVLTRAIGTLASELVEGVTGAVRVH